MNKNTIIIIAFLLFFAVGIAIISFFGLGFMTFKGGYTTWEIIRTVIVILLTAGIAYYIYKKIKP